VIKGKTFIDCDSGNQKNNSDLAPAGSIPLKEGKDENVRTSF